MDHSATQHHGDLERMCRLMSFGELHSTGKSVVLMPSPDTISTCSDPRPTITASIDRLSSRFSAKRFHSD